MQLECSEAYTACLVPLDAACLEGVALSEENYSFLTKVGLPLKGKQEINPNLPITFFPQPIVKRYPYLQHDYLLLASLDVLGELAVDLTFQSVKQMQPVEKCIAHRVVNSSVEQFVTSLGLYQSFYAQLRAEVEKQLEQDPAFSLFEHEELYEPILTKLREVDAKAMKQRDFFWRRMCEPDLV